ncbi:hypothetical protein D3C80_2109370 [compost metagenome]
MQLDHQEGRHEEQHQWDDLGDRPLGLAAFFNRTPRGHFVTDRQLAGELVNFWLQLGHQVSGLDLAID